MKFAASIAAALLLISSGASAAINVWTGSIATADYNVTYTGFRIGDLDDAADGGNFVVNGGQVPEFRIDFNGVNSENPRMVNTNFVPIAISDELSGTGLRQFALNEEISAAADWGTQGFLDTPTEATIWGTSSIGYAGFRVDRGSGNYNYGWALLEYRDGADQVELLALAIESEQNVPILAGVPEASSSLLLIPVFAFCALARRRHR